MAINKEARDGESVLSRWSRRKLEAEREPEATAAIAETAPAADAETAPPPQPVDEKPLTDADMPDVDSLTEASDFSPFMSPGVSDELRNLALRKLFRAPVFNIRDGLDEYDEDFTTFEALGNIVTSDMKHQAEMQQQKLREALAQESENDEDGMEEIDDVEEIDDTELAVSDQVDDDPADEITAKEQEIERG